MANEFIIKNGFISKGDGEINGSFYSNGSSATGTTSFAFGNLNTASGDYSHAEGNTTTASGENSHAGGSNSIASGTTSFVHSDTSTVTGNRSAILGGQNITGSEDDFVYVPSLEVNGEFREKGVFNLTGAGTITISGGTSIVGIRITGTDNVTLPNGNIGQKITIYVTDNSGVNTTIGGSFVGYTNVKLTAIGESVQLLYTGSGWVVIGGNNFVTT